MARRPKQFEPESLRKELVKLLTNFEYELQRGDLRSKVLSLIPAHNLLRDLGSSLIPKEYAPSARERIIHYLQKYPLTVINDGCGRHRRMGAESAGITGSIRLVNRQRRNRQGNGQRG